VFNFFSHLALTLFIAHIISTAHASGWDQKIISVKDGQEIHLNDLALELVHARNVILGEKHNTPSIQLAQSKVINAVNELVPSERFTTAWEFLNYTDQATIHSTFERFSNGQITAEDFLTLTQGSAKYASYAPILEITKRFHGTLIGVNLSRLDKEPVVQGGLSQAKPGTVPAQFEMGGAQYFERFRITMEGHATESQLQNYFEAQCLTDDVIADQLLKQLDSVRRFLVVGSFHSDYFDGVVAHLQKRAPDQTISVVRFVDASDYTKEELQSLAFDPKYGPIADVVYFVNEPRN
jgi:uncharacterized iron-regulated protein